MFGRSSPLQQRIKKLRAHLAQENPLLLDVVKSFRTLDDIAYRLGLLDDTQSFATRVPWWPMISVMGTFSSGKSTFINSYLGEKLQQTGNQAVDDKFTVLCYSNDDSARVLPGLALDADPRFPFYQMSRDIEAVETGEGRRVDAYLQLKTCHSENLKGKIIIDSPGFDADEQRTATLRITDHIIDLSDLVLVFFDARHPEPGAMHDTLEHLVGNTIKRSDSNKFLYVLNQIDNAAREDNPEEVFAAWQRALAQKGLTAGRFYSIYNLDVGIPIENPKLRERFEARRATDMQAIIDRIEQVEVERAYRITGVMEQTARAVQEQAVPALREARRRWRRRTLWADGIVFGALALAVLGGSIRLGYWQGLAFSPPWLPWLLEHAVVAWSLVAAVALAAIYLHFVLRRVAAASVRGAMRRLDLDAQMHEWLDRAFDKNVSPWQPLWGAEPVGWTGSTRKRVAQVLSDADRYVQSLNSRFTDPSGRVGSGRATAPAREIREPPATPQPPARGAPEKPPPSTTSGGLEVVRPPADYVDDDDVPAGGRRSVVAAADKS